MKAVAVLALIGFAVGLIGGIAGNEAWLHAGGVLFGGGALVVWMLSVFKGPRHIAPAQADEASQDRPPQEK